MALTYASITNAKHSPLQAWQRNTNAMGYGNKIRCDYMVQIEGSPRWFRVYAVCHFNVASHYIVIKGEKRFLGDFELMSAIASCTMNKEI